MPELVMKRFKWQELVTVWIDLRPPTWHAHFPVLWKLNANASADGMSWELLIGAFLADMSQSWLHSTTTEFNFNTRLMINDIHAYLVILHNMFAPILWINKFLLTYTVYSLLKGCLTWFHNSESLPMFPICNSILVLCLFQSGGIKWD